MGQGEGRVKQQGVRGQLLRGGEEGKGTRERRQHLAAGFAQKPQRATARHRSTQSFADPSNQANRSGCYCGCCAELSCASPNVAGCCDSM